MLMGPGGGGLYLDMCRLMASTLLQCSGTAQVTHLDQCGCDQVHSRTCRGHMVTGLWTVETV